MERWRQVLETRLAICEHAITELRLAAPPAAAPISQRRLQSSSSGDAIELSITGPNY